MGQALQAQIDAWYFQNLLQIDKNNGTGKPMGQVLIAKVLGYLLIMKFTLELYKKKSIKILFIALKLLHSFLLHSKHFK